MKDFTNGNFCDDKEQLYEAKELHFWLRPEAYGGYLHSFFMCDNVTQCLLATNLLHTSFRVNV